MCPKLCPARLPNCRIINWTRGNTSRVGKRACIFITFIAFVSWYQSHASGHYLRTRIIRIYQVMYWFLLVLLLNLPLLSKSKYMCIIQGVPQKVWLFREMTQSIMKEQLLKTLHRIVSLGVEFMHTKFQVPIFFWFLTNLYFVMVLTQELYFVCCRV